MKFGVLSDEKFQHPCDAAAGVLLAPRSSGTVLHLTDPSFPIPGSGNAALQAIVEHLVEPGRTAVDEPPACGAAGMPGKIMCDFPLPFGDASIGLVVCSLIDFWPTSTRRQHRLLAEIRRVLAANGELLILTRNRYGYRRLAETLRQSSRKSGILGKVHAFGVGGLELLASGRALPSQRGLRALLSKAGFRSAEWFRPLRDRRGCLTEIRPLFPREDEWGAYPSMSTSGRIRKFPQVADEFIVRASVGALETSALQRCLQEIAREITSDSISGPAFGVERFLITPKEKVVVMASLNKLPVVIRIPLSESAHEGGRRNLQALRAIDTEPARRGLAPVPLAEGETGECYYTVESWLSGDPLSQHPPGPNGLAQVESLMQRINPRSLTRRTTLDGPLYDELVVAPLAKVLALIPEAQKRDRFERFFKDRLLGKQVSVGISHGDFSLSNIFVQDGEITGVIDWDDSRLTGLPVMDALSHLSSRRIRRGGGFADTFLGLATRQWPDTDELAFLDRCYTYFRTDPGIHPALVLLFWLNVLAPQLEFWFAENPSFIQTRIRGIIDTVTSDDWLA